MTRFMSGSDKNKQQAEENKQKNKQKRKQQRLTNNNDKRMCKAINKYSLTLRLARKSR